MKTLVIGSGGREHVLCWSLAKSPEIKKLFCAPGNAGIASQAECVPLDVMDFDSILKFCTEEDIGFTVIGPEAPLVSGLADRLEAAGIATFGPSAAAARLEGSKGFMKDLCARTGVPTAAYGRFNSLKDAMAFIEAGSAPVVIKADGLAAGKGVIIAQTKDEAIAAAKDMFAGQFGDAGREVIVEEFLTGEEASYLALVDGEYVLPLETAQDHKAVGEGDNGPNTGGMGAYSPAPVMTPQLCERARSEIVEPLVKAMAADGVPFQGVFYAGLMIANGAPKLLEVNTRFGDPECQAILPRLESDLFTALRAVREGQLSKIELTWRDQPSLCVVMASKGYPESYTKGTIIRGIDAAEAATNATVFHAGTSLVNGELTATGGRVLGITSLGSDITAAQEVAYRAVEMIDWPGGFYRRDIGWRAVGR
ncbi:MAG: phosphoribosylamine--glycine ligase [Rhodospirillaceae bacterium]|nr:phosphoribosylamine--glycine ligase [Rhodospirillaceae bacterium]